MIFKRRFVFFKKEFSFFTCDPCEHGHLDSIAAVKKKRIVKKDGSFKNNNRRRENEPLLHEFRISHVHTHPHT